MATCETMDIYDSHVLRTLLSVRVFVGRPKQDTPIFTAAEAAEFSDEYIETIMEHSMMDDYTLYQYLTEADTETYN